MQSCPHMMAVITALARKHKIDLQQNGAHFRLDMPGYDRLCVERIGPHSVSVAHYFQMNGDLVAEPDVVFFVDSTDIWFPISISQSITGWREVVELNVDGTAVAHYKPQAQRDLAAFVEMWAQNIRDQGWLEDGVRNVYAVGGQ